MLNQSEWIRADTRCLNLTIQYPPDFSLQLCKSISDIPWHHTSIRIQRIPESSRINAASAKKSGVCVPIFMFTGIVYSIKHFTVSKNRNKELCCRIWDLIRVHLIHYRASCHKGSIRCSDFRIFFFFFCLFCSETLKYFFKNVNPGCCIFILLKGWITKK